MFSKTILLLAASFALLASATPSPSNVGSCNTGPMQCCNQLSRSDSTEVKRIAALNNIDLTGVIGQVGVTCTPVTVIGVGSGGQCTSNPVCCSGNNFNGVIVAGCNSVNA